MRRTSRPSPRKCASACSDPTSSRGGRDPDLIAPFVISNIDEALVLWNKMGRPATRALPFAERFDRPTRVSLLMLASLEAYIVGDMPTSVALSLQADGLATDMDPAMLPGLLRVAFMHAYPRGKMLEHAVALVDESPDKLESSALELADQARVYFALAQFLLQVRGHVEQGARFVDRGMELALRSQNPSTISLGHFSIGHLAIASDPDRALVAFEQCVALHARGPLTQIGGALYMSALLFARRGDTKAAAGRLHSAIEILYERGRSPELDGAFGYGIEVFEVMGHPGHAAVIVGAVLDGVLQVLREMPLPPGRSTPDVRAMRDALGRPRFAELVAQGAAMTYDELVKWSLESLTAIERLSDERIE
jgi:hypothetical protein